MTDTVGSAARDTTKNAGPLGSIAQSEATDRLKAEVQAYLTAQAERLLVGAGRKLGEGTGKLNDIAEGRSPGFAKLALDGGRKIAEGKGPLRTALELGASRAKDSVTSALKNLGGGKGKGKGAGKKPTVILEYVDVGVPLRTAYDQWTRFQDFSTFAKGVKNANRADDTTSDWQMKVFWSNRSWKAHTTEQIPDDRIAWTSEGAKGTTKGVISFHSVTDNLTRVVLLIEYYPKGLFEKTGNIWRAQGRRARLDLKNYVRFVTLKGEVEDGWRGEIRDGEVVRSHEDAVAEEEGADEEGTEEEGAEDAVAEDGSEDEEAYDGEEEQAEDEGPYAEDEEEGEYEQDEYDDEDGAARAEDAEPEDVEPEDEEPEAEYEEAEADDEDYEPAEGGSRR
ncbi:MULTISPECIES: SRPBCC family protein [unclassified Streptomyces]|uniref:SRPBCC family protein n=1 Tax=unclassified Streptomyces TaxID=2593676 RepID=UPI0036E8F0E5